MEAQHTQTRSITIPSLGRHIFVKNIAAFNVAISFSRSYRGRPRAFPVLAQDTT
jgi:hypothetical protein